MLRARIAVAATLTVATMGGSCNSSSTASRTDAGEVPAGQTTTTAPPMTSVLAGKKLTPPLRGEAVVEWVESAPRREKGMVITRMTVRNASLAPIARFTINETWYNKAGATVTAGRGVVNSLLQPGEVRIVIIETPWKEGMSGFQRQFTHANGTVKQVKVPQLEAPKPTTATAVTTKKPSGRRL
jgi:hypothetical protein